MKLLILIGVAFLSLAAARPLQTKSSENKEGFIVADQYYWAGSEGNLGIEFVGKFQSEEKLRDTLNFLKEIGTFQDKKDPFDPRRWYLRDILISIDLNGGGSAAKWRVSGPKPLVLNYLEQLKKGYEDKTVFYDFDYGFLDFRTTRN